MLRAQCPPQPRSIDCTLLLSLLHRTALPAAYVALGVLREGRDCCEFFAVEFEYLCEVEPVSFANLELSACRAAHLANSLRLELTVVAFEMEEVRHGVAFTLGHLLAWKHGA